MPSIRISDIDDLIDRCLLEDKKAQRELYMLYSSKVMGICRRYSYSKFEADDIFQEAFITIYKGMKSYDKMKGEFEHWLHRITVNCALKHIQKNSRNNFVDIDETNENNLENVELNDSLNAKELLFLIDQLPPGKKTIFNLYVIEGYTHKEISEMLRISEGTSKSQLAKAKEILVKLHHGHYSLGEKIFN